MRESAIATPVVKWWRSLGFITLKLSDPSTAGQPDWVFFAPAGKTGFIEFKAPGKVPTALQEKWLTDLRALGFPADHFDNSALAMRWLKEKLL